MVSVTTQPATILHPFTTQVCTRPSAVALIYHHQSWTYSQLDIRSTQLARWIASRMGELLVTQKEPLIPFCLEKGLDQVAILLAILKLGGAYVPIDREYPAARIRYMMEDIGAYVLVTQHS